MSDTSNTSPRSPVMEPRIRVRRAQVRKQEGRRRLRIVIAVLVCVTVVLAGWAATRSTLLDVDRIVVEGAAQTGSSAVVKAGGLHRGIAMFDVDEAAAQRRLRALPWIRSATVRRDWPGTVRIRVVERTAMADLPNIGGGWALVDTDGRVLKWVDAPVPGILVIAGLPPAGRPGAMLTPAARGLLDVARVLPADLRSVVAKATLDGDGLSLGLTPRGTVLLGEADDLAEKLRAAELVLGGIDTANLAVLDVRLPATPTVTRQQP